MKCPKCQTDNPETSRFCGQCAAILSREGQAEALPTKTLETPFRTFAKGSVVAGKYRILAEIGRGGMGVVYEAEDTKLARKVAIKVLPEVFAQDPERLARFEREAKVLASLNHPNIAAIYGVEEADGKRFLILELVEGETLAERLSKAPLPIEEALEVGLQMAEGLEGAHGKNIIHRDFKPSNVKMTPEGQVKILDFGLARAAYDQTSDVVLANSPTITADMTRPGVILGTAAYMSPEQARGKPVDQRADIWAFGCVLFEMLTGRAVFSGKDATDILAGVIRSEPDWSRLPAKLHWRIRELLDRCLEKEARNRYGGIGDARVEIQKALADPSGAPVPRAGTALPRGKLRLGLPWIAAIVVLTAIIAGMAVWKYKPAEPRQVMRFEYNLPEGQQFSSNSAGFLDVSSDGKQIVYSTPNGLYVRSVDEWTAKLIAGTEGYAQSPFFSPDGKWIGYFSGTRLKKIAVSGGAPIDLYRVGNAESGAWWNGNDDTIYFLSFGDIMRISANGVASESIVKAKSGILTNPQILPDGKSILYISNAQSGQPRIMIQSLKSGETKELFTASKAQYLPTEHIIYMLPHNSNLYAVPFDLERLEVKGESVVVLQDLTQYAVSESGTLAYIAWTVGTAAVRRTLFWVSREGKEEPLLVPPNEYSTFRVSPDGTRVALTVGAPPKQNIWIWDMVRETMTRITIDEGANNSDPLWTPDGKRIIYSLSHGNAYAGDIYWRAADGTGRAEPLASSPGRGLAPFSRSRDGKVLALWELALGPPQADIGMLSMEGDHTRTPLLHEKYDEWYPVISPDGRWMAYMAAESGRIEVYVRSFPDVNKSKCPISTNGGAAPLWSPVSQELFYRHADAIMAVQYETEPAFKPGKTTVLFRRPEYALDLNYWDISPDGKRFLLMKEFESTASAAASPRKINIVVNWFEELKHLVSSGKK
jgi:serine/threonine protein kinase